MAIKITDLWLTEADTEMEYFGYTVKPKNFFGVAYLNNGTYPAFYPVFWSGWTSNHAIALHIIGYRSLPIWVDGEEVEHCHIDSDTDFWAEYYEHQDDDSDEEVFLDAIPWFALER